MVYVSAKQLWVEKSLGNLTNFPCSNLPVKKNQPFKLKFLACQAIMWDGNHMIDALVVSILIKMIFLCLACQFSCEAN